MHANGSTVFAFYLMVRLALLENELMLQVFCLKTDVSNWKQILYFRFYRRFFLKISNEFALPSMICNLNSTNANGY
jgi:hypothetical protein